MRAVENDRRWRDVLAATLAETPSLMPADRKSVV